MMQVLVIVLVVLAVLAGAYGFLLQSDITFGTGVVGIGAIIAILARIAQAQHQHSQQMSRLKAIHFLIRDEIDRMSLVPSRSPREMAQPESPDDIVEPER